MRKTWRHVQESRRESRRDVHSPELAALAECNSSPHDSGSFSSCTDVHAAALQTDRPVDEPLAALVLRYLAAHPSDEGDTAREIMEGLEKLGHVLDMKLVASACHHLVDAQKLVGTAIAGSHMKTFRLPQAGERPALHLSQLNREVLLVLLAGSCTTWDELMRATSRTESQVKDFVRLLRRTEGAPRGTGLPGLNLDNPFVQEELQHVHDILHPQATRTPEPAVPQARTHGRHSVQRLLAVQPPQEWFSRAALEKYFDIRGCGNWALESIERPCNHGWLEKRWDDRKQCFFFRFAPAYRARLAAAAAGVDWAKVLKPWAMPPCHLRSMLDYLHSRGIDAAEPGQAGRVQEFLRAQGLRCVPQDARLASAQDVLTQLGTLHAPGHAVLCLPLWPAYLEVWRGADGAWLARSLLDAGPTPQDADGAEGVALSQVLEHFFAVPGRNLEIVALPGA